MKKKNIVLIVVVVIVLAVIAGIVWHNRQGNGTKVIHFGSASGESGEFAGMVAVAKELGYLEEEFHAAGYEVEYLGFANGVAVNEAMVTGDIDFSTLGDVPTATAIANDIGTKWIGVGLSSQNAAIVVAPDSDIQEISDLEGKIVSYNIGTSPQYLFESVVEYFQLDRDLIEEVNLTNANSMTSLITGDIDAAVMGGEDAQVMENNGEGRILLTTKDYPQWASQSIIVARAAFLEDNPDAAVALHRALIRAREEFIKDPDRFYVTLSGGKIEQYPELGDSIYNVDDGEFINLISEVTDSNIERLQDVEEFFYEIGSLTDFHEVSDYVDNSYYQEAKKQLEEEQR